MKKILLISIPIIIIVVVLVLLFFIKPKNEPKITKEFNITIIAYDSDNNEIYNQKNYILEEKLLDALKTAVNLTISTKINNSDEYVTGINGHMENDEYQWNYYVNDVKSTVAVSNYMLKDNDVITFKLEVIE